jgi:hypothetical protein
LECQASISTKGYQTNIGIWDKKCSSNNECPFYKKNLNYPNNYGKCINGKCQLPLGLKHIGYKYYVKYPLCYNCNKLLQFNIDKNIANSYNCCKLQDKFKKKLGIMSPDYIFNNDYYKRFKYRKHLYNKNLSIN